jgi:hypothetical protein
MAAKCDRSVMSATIVRAGSLELPLELLLLLASVVKKVGREREGVKREYMKGGGEGKGNE